MCIHRAMTKDVGIRIRVDRELRDAFQQACASENRQASDLLREFMRSYATHSVHGLQIGLFASEPISPYAAGVAPSKKQNAKGRRRPR